MISLAQKLKSAGFWQTVKVAISALIQFGYMAIMARLLTKSDFGLMALVSSFIGFGVIFSEGGMGVALIQRQDVTQRHMNAAFHASILMGILFFALFFVLAPGISAYFQQPELELMIKVAGINIILAAISSVSASLLRKHFKFKQITAFSTVIAFISYAFGILFAYSGWGVWSLVIATILNTSINSAIMFYLAPVKLSRKFYWTEWKQLFSFSSGYLILRIITYFSNSGLNLVLGKIFSPAKLGVFERTSQIKNLPSSYLGGILDTIMFPAMAQIQNDEERLFKTYEHSLGLVNSLLMPTALFLIFFSKDIILILLGSQWIEGTVPLQIMFVVLPFASSGKMADSVIRAKGLIYRNVYRYAIYALVLISTVATGAFYFGLVGAAIGISFSFLFNYAIMLLLVRNIFKKKIGVIFIKPISVGLKLTACLLPILLFTTWATTLFLQNAFLHILSNLLIILAIVLLIFWTKPRFFGTYIYTTVSQLSKKKT